MPSEVRACADGLAQKQGKTWQNGTISLHVTASGRLRAHRNKLLSRFCLVQWGLKIRRYGGKMWQWQKWSLFQFWSNNQMFARAFSSRWCCSKEKGILKKKCAISKSWKSYISTNFQISPVPVGTLAKTLHFVQNCIEIHWNSYCRQRCIICQPWH